MSHILRVNITMIAAALALSGTISGAVWAVAVRDSDIDSLQAEMRAVRADQRADHESVAEIRGDLKAIRASLERLERK
jgi:hypothetical protein